MSAQQIRDTFFAPLGQPARIESEWCPLAETRLLQLMLKFKPVGINKHINMDLIVMYMKHIYAKEEAVNVFIKDCDLESYATQLELPIDQREARFEPRYRIRPTLEQIKEKMNSWFDMNFLEYREMGNLPPELTAESEFRLPSSYYDDTQKLDRDEKRVLRKMHCPNLATPPMAPQTPCGSKKVENSPTDRRGDQKNPRRHSPKKSGRSECRSRSTNHQGQITRGKPEQRCPSKNLDRTGSIDRSVPRAVSRASRSTQGKRHNYSESKVAPVTPAVSAGSRRRQPSDVGSRCRRLSDAGSRCRHQSDAESGSRHQCESRTAAKKSSSSRRRSESRRTDLKPRKQSSKNDDTPRRPSVPREPRCTVGMRVNFFQAPDAAKKQIVIPLQTRYHLRSPIALSAVLQSSSARLPATNSGPGCVPGVLLDDGDKKQSVLDRSPPDGSSLPLEVEPTSSGAVLRQSQESSFHSGAVQALLSGQLADGVSHEAESSDPNGKKGGLKAAEVAKKSPPLGCERVSKSKSPRTPGSSSKAKPAEEETLKSPLRGPFAEKGSSQTPLDKSAVGGDLQFSPVKAAKEDSSMEKLPDVVRESSVPKQFADEGTPLSSHTSHEASDLKLSPLDVNEAEGLKPCSSRGLRNRRRCSELKPFRRRVRAVKSESSKGKRTRDEGKKA